MVGESRSEIQSARLEATLLPGMIVILLAAVILYLPSYLDSYIGDDFVQQWRIRKLIGDPLRAWTVFSPEWTNWYYRPLQNLWILFTRLIFGLTPAAYYFLQICWHLLTISLLYRAARGFGSGRLGALAAASFFAINAQHHLAVDWISSIGIIAATSLSLGAIVTFNHYLNGNPKKRFLVILLFMWMGALLFHETSIILPVFLFLVWLSHPKRRKVDKWLAMLAMSMLVLMLAYSQIQLTRENANLNPDSILVFNSPILNQISELSEFIIRASAGWIGIGNVDEWISADTGIRNEILVMGAVFLLIVGAYIFIKGSRSVRLGLTWAALQVGLIYLVLWSARPELFGGRHLYSAWTGISVALGAAVEIVYRHFASSEAIKQTEFNKLGALFLLIAAFMVFQSIRVIESQKSTQALTILIKELEDQMKEILPEVSSKTRVFASRFTLTPQYFAPAAAVWYDEPFLTGGSINVLKEYPEVTSDYYLFDTDGSNLLNLLPTLQEHQKSTLLWRNQPVSATQEFKAELSEILPEDLETEVIAGPDENRRLATCIRADAGGWSSLGYRSEAPVRSKLSVSFFSAADAEIRILLVDGSAPSESLIGLEYESSNRAPWTDIEIPLTTEPDAKYTFIFEARTAQEAESYRHCWSNPRLVVDQ